MHRRAVLTGLVAAGAAPASVPACRPVTRIGPGDPVRTRLGPWRPYA